MSEFTIGKSTDLIWVLVAGVEVLFPRMYASVWTLIIDGYWELARMQDLTLLGGYVFTSAVFG